MYEISHRGNKMKKIFTLIFTFLFAAGIAGCGKNDTISIDWPILPKMNTHLKDFLIRHSKEFK